MRGVAVSFRIVVGREAVWRDSITLENDGAESTETSTSTSPSNESKGGRYFVIETELSSSAMKVDKSGMDDADGTPGCDGSMSALAGTSIGIHADEL